MKDITRYILMTKKGYIIIPWDLKCGSFDTPEEAVAYAREHKITDYLVGAEVIEVPDWY